MPNWKLEIKALAKDFYVSQVKVNRMMRSVEKECEERKIPEYYHGDKEQYLYDNAQKRLMKMVFA